MAPRSIWLYATASQHQWLFTGRSPLSTVYLQRFASTVNQSRYGMHTIRSLGVLLFASLSVQLLCWRDTTKLNCIAYHAIAREYAFERHRHDEAYWLGFLGLHDLQAQPETLSAEAEIRGTKLNNFKALHTHHVTFKA